LGFPEAIFFRFSDFDLRLSFPCLPFPLFRKQLLSSSGNDSIFRLHLFANEPAVLERMIELNFGTLKAFGRGLEINPSRAIQANHSIARYQNPGFSFARQAEKA